MDSVGAEAEDQGAGADARAEERPFQTRYYEQAPFLQFRPPCAEGVADGFTRLAARLTASPVVGTNAQLFPSLFARLGHERASGTQTLTVRAAVTTTKKKSFLKGAAITYDAEESSKKCDTNFLRKLAAVLLHGKVGVMGIKVG